jgi:hypothetical protein
MRSVIGSAARADAVMANPNAVLNRWAPMRRAQRPQGRFEFNGICDSFSGCADADQEGRLAQKRTSARLTVNEMDIRISGWVCNDRLICMSVLAGSSVLPNKDASPPFVLRKLVRREALFGKNRFTMRCSDRGDKLSDQFQLQNSISLTI